MKMFEDRRTKNVVDERPNLFAGRLASRRVPRSTDLVEHTGRFVVTGRWMVPAEDPEIGIRRHGPMARPRMRNDGRADGFDF